MSWRSWRPYVPVAVRRARAYKKMQELRKKGLDVQPVDIEGRKIARSFWGQAWCQHLESFSDYQNRLPRGRTYVRNGSVCHLEIAKGQVKAMVMGSKLYNVTIAIETLVPKRWADVKKRCTGKISSLVELLQGKLSSHVMEVVTDRDTGLFPTPGEIRLRCDCPDWAVMCKHVAAALYGVGARLDERPELLFLLRGVDHEELISADVGLASTPGKTKSSRKRIADDALADVFGIEMAEEQAPPARNVQGAKGKTRSKKRSRSSKQKAARTRRSAASNRPPTGRAVARLRAKFGMSRSEFATLLGVSTPTIGNWEKRRGKLNLQSRTFAAWNAAKRLTKRQAWRKLERQ